MGGRLHAGWMWIVAALLAFAPALAADASNIVVLDQDRFVEANADAASGGQSAFEIADDVAQDTGLFVAAEEAAVSTDAARSDASADQISLLGRTGLQANGRSDASALVLPGDDPMAAASAISFFEVTFMVEETGRFLLEGAIDAFANSDGDALAEVWLTAPLEADTLFFLSVSGIDLEQFSTFVTLESGIQYVLTAFSTADALALGDALLSSAVSGYDVRLVMVPEPASVILLGVAALGLVRVVRQKPSVRRS